MTFQKSANANHPPILLFDMDGVLLNSRGHFLAMLELVRDPKINWNYDLLAHYKSVDIIRLFEQGAKQSTYQSLKTIYTNFEKLIPNRLRRWLYLAKVPKKMAKYEFSHNDFFPGVVETLRKLHDQGYLLGAASNSSSDRINSWFKLKNISDLFPCTVTRDDRKTLGVKPMPNPILGLLLRIKNYHHLGPIDRSRVLFTGDLATDILSGKLAGVKTAGVLTGHSTELELELNEPDFLIPSINFLPKILKRAFPDN